MWNKTLYVQGSLSSKKLYITHQFCQLCDSAESMFLGAPHTWSELGTLRHVSANTYLSTPTQFSSVQILKYIDCQFIRQLHVEEGHLFHLILWRKTEEVEGEAESGLHYQAFRSLDTVAGDQSGAVSGRT